MSARIGLLRGDHVIGRRPLRRGTQLVDVPSASTTAGTRRTSCAVVQLLIRLAGRLGGGGDPQNEVGPIHLHQHPFAADLMKWLT
jgi:hypothetical protein